MRQKATADHLQKPSLLRHVLHSVAIVAIGLFLVIVIFWLIDLAPLIIFLGVGAAYVVLTSRKVPQKPITSDLGEKPLPDQFGTADKE
ncbi:MAG: hypothetical protein C7B43_10940 [Sulfobacillus benefaciens]|uniref:Uncharacterized protein n=1 Tax=Sulfobacillus benefaciens TaxID=453960 RepID=A0A2T2X078_9FIRM|nr:MAG: hypothetical protein C7B43_10940 [Sulfobacillus benefaciens]HBQ94311.1 hypothetical protein [Sulfobacillus sp.]